MYMKPSATGSTQGGYAGTTGLTPLPYYSPTNFFPGVTNAAYPTGVAGLQLSGGVVANGSGENNAMMISGTIYVAPGTTNYMMASSVNLSPLAGNARCLVLNATLSGSGTIVFMQRKFPVNYS